ncbi:MAG: hypothetical protein AB1349_01495 [Elusimicrobiota bacterium]
MAFLREIKKNGKSYYYLIKRERDNGRSCQKIIARLGSDYHEAKRKADEIISEMQEYKKMKTKAKECLERLGATKEEIKTILNADSHKKLLRAMDKWHISGKNG